jgi:hypothetical protein
LTLASLESSLYGYSPRRFVLWDPLEGVQFSQMLCESLILVGVEASRRLSPARSPVKPVTPSSVKILMLLEAGVIGFLTFWIVNEYVFNAYFHDYVNQLLGAHGTTFTAALGLGIGLAGSAIAATLYRNLQHAKYRLETITAPKIRGAVEKILSSLPVVEEHQRASVAKGPAPSSMAPSSPARSSVEVLSENEQKKPSDSKS